ncbi:MAG: ABC transporter ATP-binding protein [Halobacteriovoraceae bacterium]|nr:ABC transporter ATP-binding protein [Halobacteriovoraceae bacterium]|tara:strand:- start:1199 stop:2794 length:1596 start_codon:yes stop_codon:yes gene_type:complete
MLTTNNVSLSFGGQKLFEDVSLKFTPGNCYGLIGANGAGKSTFVRILSGEIEPNTGQVNLASGKRMSVLKQDHFKHDEDTVLETIMKGNQKLFEVIQEKDALYAKEDFTDEDGLKAAELEAEFAEMNGWEAESDAAILLSGLGIGNDLHQKKMKDLTGSDKVKVLLGQALFGNPDVLLLDEPTNHLDIKAIKWLENFLLNFENTVIVVSHDRHFLNKVCTHIADLDFKKITIYAGNYDFWRKSSELAQRLRNDQKKKAEDKAKELKTFIARFSANASKSSQATSRQKQLEKLELDDLPMSSRKYPFIHFEQEREAGKDILTVSGLTKSIDGEKVLDNISFTLNKGDKVVFISDDDLAISTLFGILAGDIEPDSGEFKWGVTTKLAYFPHNNDQYFDGKENLVDWLRKFSKDQTETYIRGFLGKMLFSGEEALKKSNVLSGGEKVRCMLSKMMLSEPNVIMLDGPTNHLDLESITAVNEGVARFKGTVLLTTHDHEFMQTVGNRIIDLNQKIVQDKPIKYEDYIAEKYSLDA